VRSDPGPGFEGMITIERIDGKPDGGVVFDLPPEFAGAFNLMAHPTAAFAAASAIGLGFAGHAMGAWFGMMAGAMEAALGANALAGGAAGDVAGRRAREHAARQDGAGAGLPERGGPDGAGAANVVALRKPARPAAVTAASPAPVRPVAIEKPARPDDLKAIGGIGPKLEQVLNGFGVWTYAQIARWTPAEIAWVDDRLGFAGRIGRDDWTGQAARLAKAD